MPGTALDPRTFFNYDVSYLERDSAIPIYDVELPLRRGLIEPAAGLAMASCLRGGLSMLGLDEMMACYTYYVGFAEIICHRYSRLPVARRRLHNRLSEFP